MEKNGQCQGRACEKGRERNGREGKGRKGHSWKRGHLGKRAWCMQRTERRPMWLDSNESTRWGFEAGGRAQIMHDHRSHVNSKMLNLFLEQSRTTEEFEVENNNIKFGFWFLCVHHTCWEKSPGDAETRRGFWLLFVFLRLLLTFNIWNDTSALARSLWSMEEGWGQSRICMMGRLVGTLSLHCGQRMLVYWDLQTMGYQQWGYKIKIFT